MRPWILAAAVAVLATLIAAPSLGDAVAALPAQIQALGALGPLAYAGLYLAAALFLGPAALLTAVAGFAWGPLWGTLIASPASLVAASAAFLVGRTWGRAPLTRRLGGYPRLAAIQRALGEKPLQIIVLLRLSPVFPYGLLNYALALSPITPPTFVLASWLGMLPGTAAYVYLGSLAASDLADAHPLRIILTLLGAAATLAVLALVGHRARQVLQEVQPK